MRLVQNRPLSLLALLLSVPGVLCAQTILRTEPLATVRGQIVFPELTAVERQTVARQAQVFLRDLYVHRYHKPTYYLGQPDPGVAIGRIVQEADKLATPELELALQKLFCQQRDLHLNYYFPGPFNAYTTFVPVTFTRTAGLLNYFEVRVNAVTREQIEKYAPGQRVPAVGDQVIGFNGRSIYAEIDRLLPYTQGANAFGGFSRALQFMTTIPQKRQPLPAKDTVQITFRAYSPCGLGDIYTITLPWLVQWKEKAPGTPLRSGEDRPEVPLAKRFDLCQDDYQEDYQAFLRTNQLEAASVYPSNPSAERELTWGRITHARGTFGYLRLNSFSTATGPANTVNEVRRLLTEELADTDALIFDVRNNGGGAASLADTLPQLFTKKDAQVMDFRLLNNDLNHRLFNETVWGTDADFKKVINDAHGNGKIYTATAQFTSDPEANEIGQAYYKPVAVLANARSYSATDMFTTSMQDNAGGVFFGEDPKTGAGGANVVEHAAFLSRGPADVFEKMPGDHAMRVSFRQALRFAPNTGKLVEDYGCDAQFDISQTAEDLISGGEGQLDRITRRLAQMMPKHPPTVRGEGNAPEVMLPSAAWSYGIFVKNTPTVCVYVDGRLRDRIAIDAGAAEKEIRYTLPADLAGNAVHLLTFAGVDARDRQLWNLKRQVTILEHKVKVDASGFKLDFATADTVAPLNLVHKGTTTPETGWKWVKPYLQIGFGPEYVDNLNTNAILLLDLKDRTRATLDFGLEYDTEKGYDFVEVMASNGLSKKVLLSVSGKKELARYTFDLTEFAGQDNVTVQVRFTTDSNTVASGVRMTDIAIR